MGSACFCAASVREGDSPLLPFVTAFPFPPLLLVASDPDRTCIGLSESVILAPKFSLILFAEGRRHFKLRTCPSTTRKTYCSGGLEATRLGIPPVWKGHVGMGWLKYPRSVSHFCSVPAPGEERIADGVSLMVRCLDFLRGKAACFAPLGRVFFFFSSRFARCSSWARRALMIACANGPPARYMRTINYQARRTARRKPTREKASSRNWRSPREKHFASFISHGPVSWITPPVRGLTLPLIGSVPRLFRNTHRRLFGSSQASLLLQEHARGLL
jgi:hypothetical protein